MRPKVEFTSAALSALAGMTIAARTFVLEGIRVHLVENDASQVSRNKFPLRRPSTHAERELRLDQWRIFYTVMNDGRSVLVNLIGEKRGGKLVIGGEEFEL